MPSTPNRPLKPLVIYGAAGHAKVVFDVVEKQGIYQIMDVLDRYKPNGTRCGPRIVSGTMQALPLMRGTMPTLEVIVAIGDNWARARIAAEIQELCPGICFGIAIHPAAQIGRNVSIGRGTVIMACAVVNPSATVGEGCIINTRASLDHDSVMESYSSLGPGASVGGGVRIGGFSSIGIGASVIQEIHIGEHVVIGAGAAVIRDIPDCVVAHGVPAVVKHARTAGERYLGNIPASVTR
jgi:sugar O-acyltransferase (sialic acid O-acetyltransferase NeuD family)